MKSFQCVKVVCFCLFMVFVIYVIEYPKENFESNDASSYDESANETSLPTAKSFMKQLIKCNDKDFSPVIVQHGKYWLLKNFIRAEEFVRCHESITYTTHSDFTFFNNIVPLLERWTAPLSIAVYAPGDDFQETVTSILFLRNCHSNKLLVKKYATFHIFFESKFMPKNFQRNFNKTERDFQCSSNVSVQNFSNEKTFKATHNLTYPVNVARNLAREAAMTHFVLASDIELYPNPGFVESFFEMVLRNPERVLNGKNVFVLPIFEIAIGEEIPLNKTDLVELFHRDIVVWFHFKICSTCHTIPKSSEWIDSNDDNGQMKVLTTSKREKMFDHWEPIYVGTNLEPFYDERLTWEGKSDKMTQAYIMCILDYNFNVLSNAFLVHKPGIKEIKEAARWNLEVINKNLVLNEILPEIKLFYGEKKNCKIYS